MKSKLLILALIISLGINLAFVGFSVGRMSRGDMDLDPTRDYPRWAKTLPDERRAILRPMIKQQRRQMRVPIHALREHHTALREAIRAEDYSETHLLAVLDQLRDAHNQAQQMSHAAFARFVTALTPAERQVLADDLAKQPRRRPRPGHGSQPRSAPHPET